MAKKKPGNDAPRDTASRVDLGEVARILEFMTKHGLEELEYRHGDVHVRLKRQPHLAAGYAAPVAAQPAPAAARANPNPGPAASAAPAAAPALAAPPAPAENLHTVKSPIVGTFYSAPSPDAPPFVKPGDVVKRGQVLCIVEAMKLMNEIESDQDGEIVRQLAESGQPVEYGQPLFAIRPLAEA